MEAEAPSNTVEEVVTEEPVAKDDPEDFTVYHQIQNRYAFWYRYDSGKGSTNYANYNQSIKKIASFQSIERFWNIYDYLKRPADFKDIKAVEFHLFKEGISPFWEDPLNKVGGKWMLRVRKGISARYWEDILLAIIGEQFDVGAEICGAVLSVRGNEDIISVWNKTAENQEAVNKIRDQIRRIVRLPDMIPLEYKVHADSLQDKSSYRNPNMVFRPTRNDRYPGSGGSYRQSGEQGGYQHRPNWKNNPNNRYNNNNSGEAGDGNGAAGGDGEKHSGRREGGYHRDRDQQQQGDGWRRTRSDGETGDKEGGDRPHRTERNYDRNNGEVRENRYQNRENKYPPRSQSDGGVPTGSSSTTKPAPSSSYSAGGGSFASRLKGPNDSPAAPVATPEPSTASSTGDGVMSKSHPGENWKKVANPFAK